MPAVLAAEASRTAGVASRRIRPGRALRHIPVRAHARSRVRILVQVPTLLRGRDPGRDPIRQDRAQVRIRPVQAQVQAQVRIRRVRGHTRRRPRR
ncbi:hypothetical protein CEE60_12905, partial [Stenotrophomonas maltophilia]